MNGEDVLKRDRLDGSRKLDRGLHRSDVAEHLNGDAISPTAALGQGDLGVEQSPGAGIEAFDPRRRHRFRPEQEARQPLEAHMPGPDVVQGAYRRLGVSDVPDRC
jgi:hypothetical protein